MRSLIQDIRYGIRLLGKDRAATVLAVLALALGIGLVTTQFSIINGLLFKGLPFEDSERLYRIEWHDRTGQQWNTPPRIHDFVDLREQQSSFESLTAFYTDQVAVQRYLSTSSVRADSGRLRARVE